MSEYINVIAIVEGLTEQRFIESLVKPYLGNKLIGIKATQITKPGQKGGDVKFERAKKDLGLHLKQRKDTFVTTFVDYYGIKEWPGVDTIEERLNPSQIAHKINEATKAEVLSLFADHQSERRFIPFIAIHEFEALLFSDSKTLAAKLGTSESTIEAVLSECGEPEAINNRPQSSPSKRLDGWSPNGKFPKTTTGIAIASEIGIEKMREKCPVFNDWLTRLENLKEDS